MGEWQSKELAIRDKYYIQNSLSYISLEPDMSGEIHNFCNECDATVDIKITKGTRVNQFGRKLKDEK